MYMYFRIFNVRIFYATAYTCTNTYDQHESHVDLYIQFLLSSSQPKLLFRLYAFTVIYTTRPVQGPNNKRVYSQSRYDLVFLHQSRYDFEFAVVTV